MPTLGSMLLWMVAMAACGSRRGAEIETTLSAPLPELSGLARHGDVLYAVGDSASEVLAIPITDGVPAVARARAIAIALASTVNGSQLEAIAFDDAGLCWVLQEDPAAITVVDLAKGLVRHTYRLEFPAGHALADAWNAKPNARGEGLFLLPNGHVLVAKQKSPAALIEFAPAGATPVGTRLGRRELSPGATEVLVATAYWLLDADDVNDLAPGSGGSLWALSDGDHALCHIAELVPAVTPGTAGRALCDALYPIPDGLGGKTWEGLAFLDAEGDPGATGTHRAVLVVDMKATDKGNLAVVKTAPR